jgi:ABC-type transport system involved in multi-copper enzyme maturation permease subunit
MMNLLRIEGYKARRFIPLYICLGIIILMCIDWFCQGLKQEAIDYWQFGTMYDGFAQGVQDCSFSFLYGMIVAWFAGIDFTNRTLHRAIVSGNKRWKIIVSKLISTSVMIFIIHAFELVGQTAVFGKVFGFSFEGFSARDLLWLGVVALQIIAMTAFYLFITIICGNVYTALFACVTVSALGGNILRNFLDGNFIYEHSFFCLAKSSSAADLMPCAACAIIAVVVLVLVASLVFNKKDVAN